MKKLSILLLVALALSIGALGEAPLNASAKDTVAPMAEEIIPRADAAGEQSVTLDINGEIVALPFDPSPQYSKIEGGTVQASFYAYSGDGSMLYELYLVFPETAMPGDTITPASASDSSVVLIVTDIKADREEYYFSSGTGCVVFPENSDFSIGIDSVEIANGVSAYSGRIAANLVALDMATGEPVATLSLPEASFTFAIGQAEPEPEPEPEPEVERHPEPLPTTQPNDLRKA